MAEDSYVLDKNQDVMIKMRSDNVTKSEKFPSGVSWAVVGLIRENNQAQYMPKIQVDNSPHQGKQGVHAHDYTRKDKKGNHFVRYLQNVITPFDGCEYVEAFLERHFAHLLA